MPSEISLSDVYARQLHRLNQWAWRSSRHNLNRSTRTWNFMMTMYCERRFLCAGVSYCDELQPLTVTR